ncbi:MAG: C40 family peptidase [Peptostreptococcaceae bacterium]|nr:C40 family peptidase [Peptostreptococcaceae bacterium]
MFSTKEDQDIYFDSLEQIKLYDYDYIREHEPFEVSLSHEYLTNNSVNYLRFNNGYRDIYGFIIEKRYVNDEVTDLIFEIDVIQTFMFDFNIKRSFVERKKCNIDEITDFDEGLDIGEHIIQSDTVVFNKESQYYAMFNGFKKQKLIYDKDGILKGVESIPCSTKKPLTIIDYIQYPCYFMPLASSYAEPVLLEDCNYYENGSGTGSGSDGSGGTSPDSSGVVASARKLIGKPYRWGGNYPPLGTSDGTDCSGLCMWAYNDAGLLESVGLGGRWTTYTMIEHGTYIDSPSNAKPGDVIFSAFSSPGVPEHVVLISGINGNSITIIEAQQEGVPILERTISFNSSTMEIRRML